MFLTPDELFELTDCRRKSAQIEWLRKRRWRFEVTREGFPRVARAYWQQRMVGAANDAIDMPSARPNFRLIKGAA